MKDILFFHPVNDFTGSTRSLYNTIQKEYKNKKIAIVLYEDKKGFLSELNNVKLLTLYYPTYNGNGIRIFSGLVRRIHICLLLISVGLFYREFYINTILPYHGAIGAFILRKNLTYHIHEFFINKDKQIKKAEYVFDRIKSKRIYVSNYLKSCYKEKQESPSIIKYNYLPDSFLKDVRLNPIENRKRNTILMLTSLSMVKGVWNFIRLAELLPEYQFQLVISNNMNNINSFISKNYSLSKLPSNLKIFPAQNNIHPFLADCDLILNLTIPQFCIETFGLTILEAMPYSIPAIVPNVGGPTEIIEHKYNGLCVDVSDVNIVKNAIIQILSDKELYEFMASNTLKVYNEKFLS